MTPEQQYLTMAAQSQAAQLDDPHATPVCPASPEGAMPLQSATLSHKNFPIPKSGMLAALPHCSVCGEAECECRCDRNAELPHKKIPIPDSVVIAATQEAGSQRVIRSAATCRFCGAEMEQTRECSCRSADVLLDASKLPDWKDLDLRPGNVWQMNPTPKMESYEGIPAEVINEAHILGSDMPTQVLRKIEEQMKGKWAMVRLPPEEMVNVRGEQRSVDEYCVAMPVPCAVPSRAEALAMREMVEKAAEAMRLGGSFVGKSVPELIAQSAPLKFKAELRFDEGTRVVEGTYDPSFLDRPRQHDSPLSARVVPAGEAPDPKVGW